ncbi:MAG: SDR family NAD(P)-dependent oxidoreductase [Gammaproteobacteria bacterium]|nr:SDR family NAD(P)-dependent oxidoreductase [Gammaproteobacteria bacterium]
MATRKSSSSARPAESEAPGTERPGSGEPIAVVGMACRFPGAPSIESFWHLLQEGGNSVSEWVPGSGHERFGQLFPDEALRSEGCRFGAFIDDIDQFDDSFFRISPVEASLLDPQQRMMLETSWQALEDAGIDPDRLRETRTGVYTGISNDEYRMLVVDSSKPAEAASCLYALSGTNLNGAAGRVSFVLGLMGPAKAVDAACASSLVSIHDAVADLQQGKADLAIAGGVQAILNGRIYELRADAMMLSPEGQCKTFDASADGYVRGEGCGVVVLKRLSEAEADGDRIWAVIRGSAVNHGGASVGLTVPNTPALERVIEEALSQAGVQALEVDYLEAHGTGTTVGDPIEIDAVAETYGRARKTDNPLLIGSVKTNVGHLESAAGVAGLIKAVLVVNQGVIPKHLHLRDPNPRVDWDSLPLKITTEMLDWPGNGSRPRLAGVNSFGISGTNAHLVVEEHRGPDGQDEATRRIADVAGRAKPVAVSMPEGVSHLPVPERQSTSRRLRLLPLSGKSPAALGELAARYQNWLEEREDEFSPRGAAADSLLSDMAWTASIGRSHFGVREGVVFRDAESLRSRLEEVAQGEERPVTRGPATIAFAYTGQGSQWTGMGLALYESEPVARAVFDRCEAVFVEERGASLLDLMFGRDGAQGDLADTAWEQPALYALECAITALWAGIGIQPAVVLGHSVGELAAAQAAGVFSLEDGMRLAEARGSLLSATEPGAMAAVFAPAEQVAAEVDSSNAASHGVGVNISGYNGTHQVVSGPIAEIEEISGRLESLGVRVRRLNTSRAFHSALMEPALDDLEAVLDRLSVEAPAVNFVSNLTGRVLGADERLDGAYWRRHAREAVAFVDGVRTLDELGVDLVIEIGPRTVLSSMTLSAWPEAAQGSAPAVMASLRPPADGASATSDDGAFAEAVAAAYEIGLPIQFSGLFAGENRRRISLPGYPFQRRRHWLEAPAARRGSSGHPLLGVRRESAAGEITYETELFPSDPAWMSDHRVFGRIVAPGAVYGSMVASAALAEGSGSVIVEDMQLHNALVFEEENEEDPTAAARTVQLAIDKSDPAAPGTVRIFSKGIEGDWTLHVEGRLVDARSTTDDAESIDLEQLRANLKPADVDAYYRQRAGTGVNLGPFFRTLKQVWSGPGEALAEVSLPEAFERHGLDIHPLVLDGCFQVFGTARQLSESEGTAAYLPFGWEQLWLAGRLPDRVYCHVRLSDASRNADADPDAAPETLNGELRIYDPDGTLLGRLDGYSIKRATRAALLSAIEGVQELLYEVDWHEQPLPPGIVSADFFPKPAAVAAGTQLFADYLREAGVDPQGRNDLLGDLEQWSRSRALATLEELRWQRKKGDVVDTEQLRQEMDVLPEHSRLFRRMFEMLARSGVLEETDAGFRVLLGPDDPLPEEMPRDLDEWAERMRGTYSHGLTEVGLFERSGKALGDVLRGKEDALTLLFSSGEPTAADLYLKAPVARAANGLLAEAVRALVAALPGDRRLRVIEVGAGTGSATASVLPELPEGRFDYVYTDISAGFFAEAEARFGDAGGCIRYVPLDIEKDPVAQGFDPHGYDLIIASNVLHATRYLEETLTHCRELLAPAGQLVALENLTGLGWMDLTFGQLDGWWRFADDYRPHHALATPEIWRQALGDAGFESVEVLGVDENDPNRTLDKGVIVAQGPAKVREPAGVWIVAADSQGLGAGLASDLAARNQTVLLAGADAPANGKQPASGPGVFEIAVEPDDRDSWRSLIESLPGDAPLGGIVHLAGLDGGGEGASTEDMADDVRRAGASALALVQGVIDSDTVPERGLWFVTRGAQVLERERGGEPAGSVLWGFGKGVAREAPHLKPRMLDLDPAPGAAFDLVNELMYPDPEDHIAHRRGRRLAARLVREGAGAERLDLPEEPDWVLAPDPDGVFDKPFVQTLPERSLESEEVRVQVEAAGLNFWDVFRSLGFIEEGMLGREMCGYVLETGSDVSRVKAGDHVVGMGFGAFGGEMITHGELVAPAPDGFSVSELATIPSAYVSAALSFEFTGLEAGERVLIHAGAGGVGLAAIQWVQAAGAEVFATASAPKRDYLRSLGVKHVFDSRTTAFGEEILEATGGEGVDVVLNSLTSEGYIDASLACLRQGGRFVEMARRDILSEDEMAAVRPDAPYHILELDVLKKTEPARVGKVLRGVMARVAAGELKPIIHSRWPLAEAGAALSFMRSARHLGKIVATNPPVTDGHLRPDRTYLVTGGLGGIGCAVADWLAERGAGTIVLNGRRAPDEDAEKTIGALRDRGVRVEVELADVTDTAAIDRMLARMDEELPPLAGVIHSVGVLSDGALTNQSWERFEQVLWPKVLGAWHLHRATLDRDLDMFVLFSSRVGVMGNPGQANHAAANAFLDQLAGHRRALGLAGQAIAWGAWSDIGEAAEQRERIDSQRSALGGRWFTPQQGIRAFDRLVRQDATHSVVMSMDWSVFAEAVEEPPILVEDLLSAATEAKDDPAAGPGDLLSMLRSSPATAHEDLLASFLQNEVQAVLRLPSAPAPTVGFFDLGMDSLMAVELRNRVNRAFAGEYVASNTAVFDYPDITQFAAHMAEQLGDLGTAPAPAPAAAPATAPAPQAEPQPEPRRRAEPDPQPAATAPREEEGIAIVGMACRFPGAPDLAAFWRQLEGGGTGITDGRAGSGPWSDSARDLPPEFAAYRKGGFVDEIDKFDARFFRIAPIEARMLDPRQRMLLETSWQAVEDAGMDSDRLRGSRTGIYVGLASSEYRDLMKSRDRGVSYLGTATSMTVGRVAYHLGLEGPAVPVELNCASSLIAAHQAVMALRYGEVDQALVGGVNTLLSPAVTREMAELGMLSRHGQCKAFDASADGFVRSEGCGMLVLKRLDEAEADGDRIWGVIRGSAVNQNGASAGPTTPNGLAQQRVIETALSRANMAPSAVDYLEAHGAGSALGDPIEVQAAAAVYGKGRESERPLLIGSVKANIGHLEAAAGVAGLIKAVLAMRRGLIPGQLHFNAPNPNLEWDDLPVRVVSGATPWPGHSERPPRSGVSAFGISGTNAHVVLEGHAANGTGPGGAIDPAGAPMRVSELERSGDLDPLRGEDPDDRRVRMLPLSGKSEDALRQLAQRYLEWLDRRAEEVSSDVDMKALLADMSWTAAVGRTHFDFRAGLVFEDAESLRQELRSLANGGDRGAQSAAGALPATGAEAKNAPDSGNGRSFVAAAAKAYEAGLAVSFNSLFAGEERRRISLPGYPFQRRSYWINS